MKKQINFFSISNFQSSLVLLLDDDAAKIVKTGCIVESLMNRLQFFFFLFLEFSLIKFRSKLHGFAIINLNTFILLSLFARCRDLSLSLASLDYVIMIICISYLSFFFCFLFHSSSASNFIYKFSELLPVWLMFVS